MNLMGSQAPINKPTDNTDCHAHNVGDPVFHIGAAIKAWLDEFNHPAKGARANKNREQTKAASSGKGEGESSKG